MLHFICRQNHMFILGSKRAGLALRSDPISRVLFGLPCPRAGFLQAPRSARGWCSARWVPRFAPRGSVCGFSFRGFVFCLFAPLSAPRPLPLLVPVGPLIGLMPRPRRPGHPFPTTPPLPSFPFHARPTFPPPSPRLACPPVAFLRRRTPVSLLPLAGTPLAARLFLPSLSIMAPCLLSPRLLRCDFEAFPLCMPSCPPLPVCCPSWSAFLTCCGLQLKRKNNM